MKNSITITHHPAPGRGLMPASGSIAIAQGLAPRGSRFALKSHAGQSIALQTQVLGRWPDGSTRWVHLDYQAPAGNRASTYQLQWANAAAAGTSAKDAAPQLHHPVKLRRGPVHSISTDQLSLNAPLPDNGNSTSDRTTAKAKAGHDLLQLAGWSLQWSLVNARNQQLTAKVHDCKIEPGHGPLRSTLSLQGDFVDSKGKRFFAWRLRATLFADSSLVKLEPMMLINPDAGVIHKFKSMSLNLRPTSATTITPLCPAHPDSCNIMQVDDEQYQTAQGVIKKGQWPGSLSVKTDTQQLTLAVRDFAKRWPKGLRVNDEQVSVDLFPAFNAGQFDHMQPDYKYDYLFEGSCYRVKTGQTRRWEIWLDTQNISNPSKDAAKHASSLEAYVNTPSVLLADPKHALLANVWEDGLIAEDSKAVKDYDRWVKKLFKQFLDSQHQQRDYGEMNLGDWFGERNVNWGNNEYDTSYELFFHASRMNDPTMYRTADAAARHASEVDVVHFTNDDLNESYGPAPKKFHPRPGMMHEHCVGHVGGFHTPEAVRKLLVSFGVGQSKKPYLCLDPFNLGHIWTRGITKHYFLTGDPWSKETVRRMGDSLAMLTEAGDYPYFSDTDHSGRVAGWTLTALAGAYELDYDKRYLRAMKHIVDLNLKEQNANSGGWHYTLSWGHCFCLPVKHVGEAGFLTAIRLNGLYQYYKLTGDKRIPKAIERGVTHLNNDTWKEEYATWRYTSCPASVVIRRMGAIFQALASSVMLTGNAEHKRILERAWIDAVTNTPENPGAGLGKNFTTSLLGSSQTMAALYAKTRK